MVVVSRWKCKECGNICEKKPAFHLFSPEGKKKVNPYGEVPEGYTWKCTTCMHPASQHHFIMDKPKKNE